MFCSLSSPGSPNIYIYLQGDLESSKDQLYTAVTELGNTGQKARPDLLTSFSFHVVYYCVIILAHFSSYIPIFTAYAKLPYLSLSY